MRKIAVVYLISIFISTIAFAGSQPGTYDSHDWNAGQFDPGGGIGSSEGMRVVSYRIDPDLKPTKPMLKKEAALEYIGDIKEKLISGYYTGEILLRTKPDPKHHTLSDGTIFNTNGGRNYYITRKDGEHMIMLDSPGGRQEIVVTETNFPKFENAIHDDNGTPYVLFDLDGNEAAIVFLDWHTKIKQKFTETGDIIIILKGARPVRGRQR